MFRESSIVLYHKYADMGAGITPQVVDFQKGTPGSVDFDFFRIWNAIKNDGATPQQLHYYHVHPSSYLRASSMDRDCMIGWSKAFGTSIYNFHIITFKKPDLNSIDYAMSTYVYDKRSSEMIQLSMLHTVSPLPAVMLSLLKLTSYGEDTCQ